MPQRHAIDAVFGEDLVPRLRAARCVRRRRADDDCRACLLACPHQALWFDADGTWRLHAAACDGCGACASACPSQAIDAPGIDLAALRRAWRDRELVTLGCREGGPDAAVRLPCLAGLHPESLASALLGRPSTPVRLDLSACGCCAKGALRPVIEAQARQAVAYVQRLGVAPDVHIADGTTGREGGSDGRARPISRRELFQVAHTRGCELVARGIATLADDTASGSALPHRAALLAAARKHVTAAADEADELSVLGAFFVDWKVADACDGCQEADRPRCLGACPNGAWRLGSAGAEAVLSHDAASCSGCGACRRSCPRSALEPQPAPLRADAGRLAKRTFALARCRICRQRPTKGADGLCGNCRKRQQVAASVPQR